MEVKGTVQQCLNLIKLFLATLQTALMQTRSNHFGPLNPLVAIADESIKYHSNKSHVFRGLYVDVTVINLFGKPTFQNMIHTKEKESRCTTTHLDGDSGTESIGYCYLL